MTPGVHEVEMIYIPVGLKIGIVISAGAWLIFMLGVLLYGRRKREEDEEEASGADELEGLEDELDELEGESEESEDELDELEGESEYASEGELEELEGESEES